MVLGVQSPRTISRSGWRYLCVPVQVISLLIFHRYFSLPPFCEAFIRVTFYFKIDLHLVKDTYKLYCFIKKLDFTPLPFPGHFAVHGDPDHHLHSLHGGSQ